IINSIASQTNGDARAVTPVQDQIAERLAVALAPRFCSNSYTSTQTTSSPSTNHGLAKPEGRLFVMSSEVACQAVALYEGLETSLDISDQRQNKNSKDSFNFVRNTNNPHQGQGPT